MDGRTVRTGKGGKRKMITNHRPETAVRLRSSLASGDNTNF